MGRERKEARNKWSSLGRANIKGKRYKRQKRWHIERLKTDFF